MSDHLREFRVHSRSKLRTTAREISRRERGEGGGGKGKARLEGTTFGLEGGIPVIRRIRERRKTDGSWPGLDGRTDERASERRGGR